MAEPLGNELAPEVSKCRVVEALVASRMGTDSPRNLIQRFAVVVVRDHGYNLRADDLQNVAVVDCHPLDCRVQGPPKRGFGAIC
jgi:hypothetical protein